MKKFLGIDFGTSNSTCAVVDNGRAYALDIDGGSNTLQSLIYINPKHETVVGSQAVSRYLEDVENIASKPPQIVPTGKYIQILKSAASGGFGGYERVAEMVEMDISGRGRLFQSLKSVLPNREYKGTRVFEKFYNLEDLLTILLKELKIRAEEKSGCNFDKAVIGRPVKYLKGPLGQATAIGRMEKIAKNAGFKDVFFEYEPVGAALNFGVDIKTKSNILTFDFGGGTLDICIMSFPEKKVLATVGIPIGGDLMNTEIFKSKLLSYFGEGVTVNDGKFEIPKHLMLDLENWYSISRLKTKANIDSIDYLISIADEKEQLIALKELILSDSGFKIYQEVNKAKIELSSQDLSMINFSGKSFDIKEAISKVEFEDLIKIYLDRIVKLLNQSLDQAGIKKEELDMVITTGGSSNIPAVKNLLVNYFGKEKITFGESFTSVALGLALKAESLFG